MGKGSKQRPTDLKKFRNNFNEINWKSKKKCNCKKSCNEPCKGECGCKECHDDYMDFLSAE